MAASTGWAQFGLPAEKALPGWKFAEKPQIYTKNDLYGYMDGGAELFFEYGFQDLTVQKYAKAGGELALEAYRFSDAEGALGLYLIRAGKEILVKGVEGRSTGDRYQFSAVKGNYFFQVDNFKGDVNRVPDMIRLMNAALASLVKDWPAPGDPLPKEYRVPNTFLILRGPLALQRLITLGEGDILQLQGKIAAYAADYEDPKQGGYTLMQVAYPDAETARKVFDYASGHLDSYLNITKQSPSSLAFKDSQDHEGEIVLSETILSIRVGTKSK